MVRLTTFGTLTVTNGAIGEIGPRSRSRLAVLAVIAAAGERGVRREKLTALFWPDSDEDRARNALRQALFSIRRELGGAEIVLGAAELRLNPAVITADVADFEAAVDAGRLEAAADLYRGPFLDGVLVKDAPEFDRWVDEQRARLAAEYARILERLAVEAAQPGLAAGWWARAAAHDLLSARVARRYMEALVASDDRATAIRHAAVYAAAVRSELDAEPETSILQFAEQLRAAPARLVPSPSLERHTAWPPGQAAAESIEPVPEPLSSPVAAPPAPRRRWFVVAGLVSAIAAGALWFATRGSPERAVDDLDPRRVVVADFDNRTGDPTFDLLGATLADFVTQGVIQAGFTTVVDPLSRAAVRRAPLATTGDSVNGVARAAAAGTLVSGSFARQGDRIVIAVRITDEVRNRVLTVLEPISAPSTDPLQAATTVRDLIAGALASALDARIASITLPSSRPPLYAAYQEFILGLDAFQSGINDQYESALSHFERAAALDSTFTLPLIWSAFAYGNTGRQDLRESVVQRLAERAPPAGSLEALQLREFQAMSTDEGLRLRQEGAARSPGSTWSNNAGVTLHDLNRLREAIPYFEQVDPEHGWVGRWTPYWLYYTRALHGTGAFDRELQVARRALALNPRSVAFRSIELRALASVDREIDRDAKLLSFIRDLPDVGCVPASPNVNATVLELRTHAASRSADSLAVAWVAMCESENAAADPREPTPVRRARLAATSRAYYRGGRLDEAERTVQQLAVLGPGTENDVEALDLRGRIAARRGDRAAAVRTLDALRTAKPLTENALFALAAIGSILGEPDMVMRDLLSNAGRVKLFLTFHRDPDYATLWLHPPFAQWATPK